MMPWFFWWYSAARNRSGFGFHGILVCKFVSAAGRNTENCPLAVPFLIATLQRCRWVKRDSESKSIRNKGWPISEKAVFGANWVFLPQHIWGQNEARRDVSKSVVCQCAAVFFISLFEQDKKRSTGKNMFPMCEGFHKRDDGRTSAACVLGNATRLKEHLAGYADTEFSFAEPNPPSSFSSSSSSVH